MNRKRAQIDIRNLTQFRSRTFKNLAAGYSSDFKYLAEKFETREKVTLSLNLTRLPHPYLKKFTFDSFQSSHYRKIVRQGWSIGAFNSEKTVGLAIAEKWDWNRCLWIWEFHVSKKFQRQGIGKKMMERIFQNARDAQCRVVVCETQNTNFSAIEFYRKMGFDIQGVDFSYYDSTPELEDEFAIFMKKAIA
jgi:ribosomal protein S18 acetylase RimI-like enzyme